MDFVKSLSMFHLDAKEIPCVTGEGTPTEKTEGAPGVLYMDTLTGTLYKCRAADLVNAVFTWEAVEGGTADAMRWRGEWSDTDVYEVNDVVTSDGALYVCLIRKTPMEPGGSDDWALLAKGGDSGYTLPVGGDQLGGVKNGGNVVINEDGTMTAPSSGSSQNANGGLSATASALLLTILKDCYTGSNQDANILALENELLNNSGGSGGDTGGEEPEEPDVPTDPDEPVEPEPPTLTSISAVLNQDNATVGTVASDLDITVTAHYSDDSSAVVTDYSISGTVASGENTFTIVYSGKTTTIKVTGTAIVYSLYNQDMSGGAIDFGVELKEFKSFTVKLDITINTSRKDKNIFIWSMPSTDSSMYWFSAMERNTGKCSCYMFRASYDYAAIGGNVAYASNDGDRLQFVATYNVNDDSCALYLSETPSGGTMVQNRVTANVDRTKFDGVLNAGTNGNSHELCQGTYTVNACEISFEHTSEEDATAWIEREV